MALELGFTNSFRGSIDNDKQWYSSAPNANTGVSYEEVVNEDFQFDMDAHDVMVFLHIQKTGGTSFGKHLVMDLDLKVIRYCYWSRNGASTNRFDHFRLFFFPNSGHVSASQSENDAIVFERIAMKIGFSPGTRPDGNVVCTQTGLNSLVVLIKS